MWGQRLMSRIACDSALPLAAGDARRGRSALGDGAARHGRGVAGMARWRA